MVLVALTVGDLVAYLRLDDTQFQRGMASLDSGIDRVVGGFGRTLSAALTTAGVAAGGAAALGIRDGLSRVLATEDARKMFSQMGLGVDAIDSLFGELEDTFGRSAFRFPDVYNISAQLRASGTATKDLNRQMRNVGNVAAIAGGDLLEIGDIFAKIAAEGTLSAVRMDQFATRGVNLAAALAPALGVTEARFREMVSAGEISNEMMHDLIGQADLFSGAMDNMGTTTRSAWSNMISAVGRAGEAFLAPWFGEGGTVATWLNQIEGLIYDKVIPAVASFGEWAHTTGTQWLEGSLVPALRNTWEWLTRGKEGFDGISDGVKAIAGGMAGFAAGGAFTALGSFLPFLGPLGMFLRVALSLLGVVLSNQELMDSFKELGSAIAPLVTELGVTLAGAVVALADVAVPLLIGALDVLLPIVQFLGDNASWLAPTILGIVAAVKIWTGVQWLLNAALAANPLGLIIMAIAAVVAGVILLYKHSETFRNIIHAIGDAGKWLWEKILKPAWEATVAHAKFMWDHVKAQFERAKEIFFTVRDRVTQVRDWIRDRITSIVDFFRKLPGRIKSGLSNLKDRLLSPFKAAFNAVAGLWNRSLGNISFSVPDWVPGVGGRGWSFPQIPMLADGGRILRSGLALVGEAGPELLHLPRGAAVEPLGHGGGGVAEVRGTFILSGDGFLRGLREEIQVQGGNVQAFFGGR